MIRYVYGSGPLYLIHDAVANFTVVLKKRLLVLRTILVCRTHWITSTDVKTLMTLNPIWQLKV